MKTQQCSPQCFLSTLYSDTATFDLDQVMLSECEKQGQLIWSQLQMYKLKTFTEQQLMQ